jgi:hypothetical protein
MAPMATTRSSSVDLESSPRRAVLLEELVILVGHAEQQRDHQRRHRQREISHQIERGTFRDDLIDETVDQLLNLRPHCLSAPEREIPCHHSTKPIVLRIVDPGKDDGHVVARRRFHRVRNGVRTQSHIDECRLDVVIPADHPGLISTPLR